MLIYEVQSKIVTIVRLKHHEKDPVLKKLFSQLGPLIKADRDKKENVPGFPDLNRISLETNAVLAEINTRCDQAYNYTIL